MRGELSFVVTKRDGRTEPYRRGILKEDLVSGFGLTPIDADTFVRAFELDVLRRRIDRIDSGAIKRLVYDYKAAGPVALAVERLNEVEFGTATAAPALDSPAQTAAVPREFTRRGPAAPVLLAADAMAAFIEPVNEPLARVVRHSHEVAAVFLNEAIRERLDDLVALLDPLSFVTSDLKAQFRRSIEAGTADIFVRPLQRAVLIQACTDCQQAGALKTTEDLAGALYDAHVENLRRRQTSLLPPNFDDDLAAGEVYRMVASLERKGDGKPLGAIEWPLYCHERVETKDDLDGAELTYQRTRLSSLYTNDTNDAREFVSRGWAPVTAFPEDLPEGYRRNLQGPDTLYYYAWFLLERERTDSILDEILDKLGDGLQSAQEEIGASAAAKFGEFLGGLAAASPFPLPAPVKEAAGQLAAAAAGWLLDLLIELLDGRSRPFPSVQIAHRVLYPAGRKPLSLVWLSTRAAASDSYKQARFAYYRASQANPIATTSDERQDAVIWFGASQPAPRAPRDLFVKTAESNSSAVFWRPTDGVIAPRGFGATVRQQNVLKPNAIYVSMLRADLRKDLASASVSGTGTVTGS